MTKQTNIKKILLLAAIVALLTVLFCVSASAAIREGTCGEKVTWGLFADGMLVIDGEGDMDDYETGTSPWYNYSSSIKTIVIGEKITGIGKYAFVMCDNLVSLTIGENVTEIGAYAFYGCSSLPEVSIPKKLVSIGANAFAHCGEISEVTIPDSVETIGDQAFYCCGGLVFVSIGSKVTSIGEGAFRSCYNLPSITIPDNVTSIGNYAFHSCTNLTSVILSENIASLSTRLFYDCVALASVVIPDSVTSIERGAFHGCVRLASVMLPDNLERIGDEVFYDCVGLTSIEIPDSVTSIQDRAFGNCTGFTSVTIPDSVNTLGEGIFYGCINLEQITIPFVGACAKTEPGLIQYPFGYIFGRSYYSGSVKAVQHGEIYYISQALKSVIVTGGEIFGGAFYNCSGLVSITLPDEITSIGQNAFYKCSGLLSITIPESVKTIGTASFYNCAGLTSVTIPDGVTSIGREAFLYCTGLSTVTISNSVTLIDSSAFAYCESLTSITIPASVKRIETSAFKNCSALASAIVLPSDVLLYGPFPTNTTIYGFAGSTAETYAFAFNRTFVPLATEITSVFELEATYTPDASKAGQYVALATFNRVGADASAAVDLLYVEGATGALCVKSTEGVYLPLRIEDGSSVVIGAETVKVAVVYDDNTGVARFYVDGVIPYVSEEMVLAILLPVHDAAFHTIAAVTDTFDTLDGVSVTNVYNVNASATAEFIGFQVNNEDSASIRLLAGIDMLYYGSLGFDVELYSAGNLQGTVKMDTHKVFTGVMANGVAVSAASEGYRYMTALTINGIQRPDYPSDVEVYFLVKPYTMVGGVKTYGEIAKILIAYDAASGEHIYTVDESYVAE